MDCFLGMCRYGLLPKFLNDLLASWWRLRWWGAAPRLTNFIPRLRTFCNANGLLRMILLVAADTVDEDLAKHGKTTLNTFKKTCLNHFEPSQHPVHLFPPTFRFCTMLLYDSMAKLA